MMRVIPDPFLSIQRGWVLATSLMHLIRNVYNHYHFMVIIIIIENTAYYIAQ